MSYCNSQQIILRQGIIQHQAEAQQDPRQIRGRKHKQPQKAQINARIPPGPDVDEGEAQRRAQERHARERTHQQQRGGRVEDKPCEIGGLCERFFQVPAIARHEEEVEHEVDRQRAEVEEGG
jgi:hypothetical protein